MAEDIVSKFRSLKWGDPEHKLKMIPDAVPRELAPIYFACVTMVLGAVSFGFIYLLRTAVWPAV